jgi:signal transduction histidine kinase
VHARPSAAIGYVVAVVVTLLTFFARDYLETMLGDRVPLLPFVFAVVVSAWYGGLGPGLLATSMGVALAGYFFLQPDFSIASLRPETAVGLLFFVLTGVTASCLFEALHKESARSQRAEEALREADRRKDEFIAIIAHELRTPLAPLANALQVLRVADADADRRATAYGMMERHVQQIARLVEDLLDLNRIARGTLSLRKEGVDLAAVLQRARELSQPAIDAGKHELALRLPPQPLCVQGDPARLAQVFANLLNNAARYTAAGGRIDVVAERQGGDAVIRVRDNGNGIPRDMLERIFEMFTQLSDGRASSQSGLGIGLTIVRRLVELHGGRIEARSDGPGRGSEFVVRLPEMAAVRPLQKGAGTPADIAAGS